MTYDKAMQAFGELTQWQFSSLHRLPQFQEQLAEYAELRGRRDIGAAIRRKLAEKLQPQEACLA